MKFKQITAMFLTIMILFTPLLSACSKTKPVVKVNSSPVNTNANENLNKPTMDKEQVLNLKLFEPLTLDPNKCDDSISSTIIAATQEGLLRIYNKDGTRDTIVAAGARDWEVSDDGLVYTFNLRDYNWSDGKPVTAQHYVDSFRRLLDPKETNGYAYLAFDIKNAEEYYNGKDGAVKPEDIGVTAKDDKTLVMTLEKPTPYFIKKLYYACFYPVRLDVINAGGENWGTDISKQVCCGPYKIKEWAKNSSITMVKNDKYWDANNVFLEKVVMNKIEEFNAQAQLFELHQLDVTGSTKEYIEKWTREAQNGKCLAFKGNMPGTWYISFNQKNGGPSGLMKNKKIRLALSMAFDRKELLDKVYGRCTPALGFIPYSVTIGDREYRSNAEEPLKRLYDEYKANPTKLRELFKEGLKELGRSADNLKDVHLKYITNDASNNAKQEQELLKQQFGKNLGITIDIAVISDSKAYTEQRKTFKFDLCLMGWNADYDDPMAFLDMWDTNSNANCAGFSNAEYDSLLKSLNGEKDINKREVTYKKLERILILDEAGISPYFYNDTRRFIQNYVKDFMSPMFGSTYEWRWAYIQGRS